MAEASRILLSDLQLSVGFCKLHLNLGGVVCEEELFAFSGDLDDHILKLKLLGHLNINLHECRLVLPGHGFDLNCLAGLDVGELLGVGL